MSRILSLLKRRKVVILCLLIFFFIIALLIDIKSRSFLLSLIFFLLLLLYVLNLYVYREIQMPSRIFLPTSKIRNVDYLIIGDLCCVEKFLPENSSHIEITAPDRSLKSSFEILRHVFCILNEDNANVIITVKKKKMMDDYSLFDYPIFNLSSTSMKRLGLIQKEKKLKFPILFEPLKVIKYLLNIKKSYSYSLDCMPKEIIDFCNERNIRLHIYTDRIK